ncbi:hypothetical protein Tco_0868057 [Tanacetum coccineum]
MRMDATASGSGLSEEEDADPANADHANADPANADHANVQEAGCSTPGEMEQPRALGRTIVQESKMFRTCSRKQYVQELF